MHLKVFLPNSLHLAAGQLYSQLFCHIFSATLSVQHGQDCEGQFWSGIFGSANAI